jgi:hypothetical protein
VQDCEQGLVEEDTVLREAGHVDRLEDICCIDKKNAVQHALRALLKA